MKKKTNESAPVSGLAFLVESELEKAQVVLAAKGILEKLQKMAEDLAKVEADDIMPILDSMRLTFGPELTDSFNDVTTAKIRATMEAVKDAKEGITHQVARLEGDVNGEEVNDMAMDDGSADADLGMGGDDMDGLGDMDGDVPDLDTGAEDGSVPAPAPAAGGDDLDAAFDAAASDTTAAGRARKESVERNVKALTESRNPDRLVFETFRRTLKECKAAGRSDAAVKAAKAVAEAFAIDYYDVVAVIKEGKTFKDEKDKKKATDWQQARKDKKRDRPSDIDEGKTFKDERDRKEKNTDFAQARKDKKRDRPSDLDEATFGGVAPAKAPFGKKKHDDSVPDSFRDMQKKKGSLPAKKFEELEEGMPDCLKDRLEKDEKRRSGKPFVPADKKKEETVEEGADGAKVLVMKQHNGGTTPKQKPFSVPAKKPLPKK